MKTYNLTLEDGTELTLRLTSTAIAAYVKAHGIPGAALLTDIAAAADDIEKQITLLSKALQHPGNNNKIKDGGRLLDLLADEGKDAAFRRWRMTPASAMTRRRRSWSGRPQQAALSLYPASPPSSPGRTPGARMQKPLTQRRTPPGSKTLPDPAGDDPGHRTRRRCGRARPGGGVGSYPRRAGGIHRGMARPAGTDGLYAV